MNSPDSNPPYFESDDIYKIKGSMPEIINSETSFPLVLIVELNVPKTSMRKNIEKGNRLSCIHQFS
jgi:hypothetical protein